MPAGYGFSSYGTSPYGFGTIPWPIGTSKLVIPHPPSGYAYSTYSQSICFQVWIDPSASVDTAFLCKGGGTVAPDWYVGQFGTDVKMAISDETGAFVETTFAVSDFQYMWVPVTISFDYSTPNTSYFVYFNGIPKMTGTFSSLKRQIGTDDIISGMGGRIRNIRIINSGIGSTGATMYRFRELNYFDLWVDEEGYATVGSFDVNDNSSTIVDTISANNGTLYVGSWSNGANDLSAVGSPSWVSTSGIGRRDTSKIGFDRQVLDTTLDQIVVERDSSDSNRDDIFVPPRSNTISSITDDASGVIITFDDPFLKDRQSEISLRREIGVLGGGTVAEGTQYTWTLPGTTDLGYEILRITPGVNSVKVDFGVDIKEGNGTVDGIDPAMWEWHKSSVVIYTDDTGARTLTLSGFTDVSGNIVPEESVDITILESAITFDYQGMQMIQSKTYKDGFAQSVSRDIKNYVSDKLRQEQGE